MANQPQYDPLKDPKFSAAFPRWLQSNKQYRIAKDQLPVVDDFHAFTYEAGWSDVGGGLQAGGYWKDNYGMVHIVGTVTGPSLGAITFLTDDPITGETWRPESDLYLSVVTDDGAGSPTLTPGLLIASSAGGIVLTVGDFTRVHLSGIIYKAA